jgi:malic enzyme
MEGMKLVDVIKTVRPTILIGLSGCGGIFNGEAVF